MAHSSENHQSTSSQNFTGSQNTPLEKAISHSASSQEFGESTLAQQEKISSARTLQPGQIVGSYYEVVKPLEENHSLTTYLVKDRQEEDGSWFILELIYDGSRKAQNISEKAFLQQVRFVKKLSTYIQIPKLLSHGILDRQYYAIYEYTDGKYLDRIMRSRTLNEPEIVSLIQDVARIYDFIIKSNIVDFTLLPEHIFKNQVNNRYVLGSLKELFFRQVSAVPLSKQQQRFLFHRKLQHLTKIIIQSLIAESRDGIFSNPELPLNWQKKVSFSPRLQTILGKIVAERESNHYSTFQEIADDFEPLLQIDRIIGKKYRLISYLGSKSNIRTYLARNLQKPKANSSLLIVKQLTIANRDRLLTVERVDSLEREIRQINQLSIVDGIDFVKEQSEDVEDLYLIRDYVEGVSLAKRLKQQRFFPLRETIELVEKALHQLEEIHRQGLIHRNVKPSNLILSGEDREITLVDLGILQAISQENHDPNHYQQDRKPPEQIVGRPTNSSDLYALGIVAIEILTGLSFKQITENSSLKNSIWQKKLANAPFLIPIIEGMICPDVAQRYQSTQEVLQDIQKVKEQEFQVKLTPTITTSKSSPKKQQLSPLGIKTRTFTLAIAVILGFVASLELISPIIRPQYYVYRGKQQLAERPKRALTTFEKALKLQPTQVKAWEGKGDAFATLQQFEPALEAYEQAIQINYNSMASWQGKGNVFYLLGNFQEALLNYERALVIQPNNVGVLRRKGKILYLSSRYEEALSLQRKALQEESNPNSGLLSDTALSSLALGRNNQALNILNRVQNIAPNQPYLWQEKVLALGRLNLTTEASEQAQLILEIYNRELKKQPHNLDLWLGKGTFLGQLKRYQEALNAYQSAIAIAPDNPSVWLGESEILIATKQYDKALESVERALELKPHSFVAWHTRGLILQAANNNLEQAVAAYDKAIEINQDFFPSWRDRSSVLIAQKNYPQAINSLRKAVALAPQDIESWLTLTNVLQKMQKIEDAIKAMDRVIVLQPRNSQYWLQKGSLWENKQQYTKACDIYRQAMTIAPDLKITGAMQRVGCTE